MVANEESLSSAMEGVSITRPEEHHQQELANFSSDAPLHIIKPYYINVHDESELIRDEKDDDYVQQLIQRYEESEELQVNSP